MGIGTRSRFGIGTKKQYQTENQRFRKGEVTSPLQTNATKSGDSKQYTTLVEATGCVLQKIRGDLGSSDQL